MKKNIKHDMIMAPLPVLIIGTYDENGIPNAMNAAWGTQCDMNKITVFLSKHKTTDNLELNKEFTVAFATKDTLEISDYFGIESGHKLNKIEKAGVHVKKAEFVDAPLIEEYPVTLECKMTALNDDGGDYRLVGEVVNIVAEESVLDENGHIDLKKLEVIAFDSAHNTYRVIGDEVGRAFHDGLNIKNS